MSLRGLTLAVAAAAAASLAREESDYSDGILRVEPFPSSKSRKTGPRFEKKRDEFSYLARPLDEACKPKPQSASLQRMLRRRKGVW